MADIFDEALAIGCAGQAEPAPGPPPTAEDLERHAAHEIERFLRHELGAVMHDDQEFADMARECARISAVAYGVAKVEG